MQRNMIFYALLALGPFAARGDVREEFGRIDVDKDGSISLREYEAVRNFTFGEAPESDATVWAVCGTGWIWNPDTVYREDHGVLRKCGDLADWCGTNQNTEACQEDPSSEEKSDRAQLLYRSMRDRRCCTLENDVFTFTEVQFGKRRRNQPSFREEFGRIDVDKDGRLSFREFEAGFGAVVDELEAEFEASLNELEAEVEATRNSEEDAAVDGNAPYTDAHVEFVCGAGMLWNPEALYVDERIALMRKCGHLSDYCDPSPLACAGDFSRGGEELVNILKNVRFCCTRADEEPSIFGRRRKNDASRLTHPTEDPTNEPTAEPTEDPTSEPTPSPTQLPTTRAHADSQERSGLADGPFKPVNDMKNLVADKPAPIRRRSTLKRFLPHFE